MISVEIKGMKEIQAMLKKLPDELQNKATAPALNKTVAKARTEMTRAITDRFNIRAADVRNSLEIQRASSSRRSFQIAATLRAFGSRRRAGRSLNLIHFLEKKISMAEANRRRKNGSLSQLRFQIKKGGGPKTIDGAFIGNKGRTVFMREGRARLPIKPVQAIDVPQMFNARVIMSRVLAVIDQALPIEIERAIKMVLARMQVK